MALMMGSLYEALRSANVEDAKAIKAAEEIAGYENRLAGMDNRLAKIESRMDHVFWMLGVVLALCLAILARLFFIGV